MLPMALTVCSDAYAGLLRITKALLSEELADDLVVDKSAPDVIFLPLVDFRRRADLTLHFRVLWQAIRAYGNFRWETATPGQAGMGKGGGRGGKDRVGDKAKKQAASKAKKDAKLRAKNGESPTDEVPELEYKEEEKPPFQLLDIDISIPRGGLTCVVGTIGSGKVRPSCFCQARLARC